MAKVNITRDLICRQIKERGALSFERRYHVTDPFIRRLGLEAELQGHSGCVNCLEWNEKGDLLASGSDDQHTIVWDPLHHKKLLSMHTGHTANIFSVKQFLPHAGDRILITGAADSKVHVHDLTVKETIHMFGDHTNRVKRIATAPMWPNTFWSAAEDGLIRQYDLRENSKHSEVLIDLTEYCGQLVEAKCLTVNPQDNNCLAVGASGPFVRLYDIRMIHNHRKSMKQSPSAGVHTFCDRQKPLPDGAAQYYVAGHLPVKLPDYNNRLRVLVATYVTFSPNGTELLVNMGGEQVYLFDLTYKQRPYTFLLPRKCHSSGEVQNGKMSTNGVSNGVSNGLHLHSNGFRLPESRGHVSPQVELPPYLERVKQQANEAFACQQWTQAIQLYSKAVQRAPHNAMLYGNRAAAYMKRKWDGDHYDALRDCLKAISLNPCHLKAHFRLARCLFELKYVAEALECLDDFKGKFPEQAHSSACDALGRDITAALFSKNDGDEKKGAGGGGSGPVRLRSTSRKDSISEDEMVLRERSYDYQFRYCGHCNTTTDIKEANFFGSNAQYIVSGSDDGSFFIWEKETTNLVRVLQGDESIVNCLQPHPSYCFLATSGIDPVVRLWNPRPESEDLTGRVVEDMEGASQANQRRMNADPLEVMLLNMGYRITGLSSTGAGASDDEDSSEGQVQCRPS
ncbi:WD and tetratricopeptide repeats protein 1 isoform X1 [Mesoplodon densirostris]|uniref:WD and tetratricopeptide repeats protein 1 isoform X1 n=1 Tax=Mesoplodon densirostris TaxID=48708 RepID=UPI0028DB2A99|nr:WD and tetratricopeptide repeats protein 1 isoform X1 [Mesoplodon densirostris]XP_059945212.1 WD and tetratricopeptide repeats protein 1 isoform X1 [Mesoplodon densirostris]XP_059945213.1 WD and tetratricopeptide repeats protein 1 isoform X1 [Mesoplodon densirostris]